MGFLFSATPYLYGRKFVIQLSGIKEPNSKLQRWKCKLEEYNFTIEYIKGKNNIVADALSRPELNTNEIDCITVNTCHSAEEDSSNHIELTENPLNMYNYQLIVNKGATNRITKKVIYKNKIRTTVIIKDDNNEKHFIEIFKQFPRKGIIAVLIEDLNLYVKFQNAYVKWKDEKYKIKLLKTGKFLQDVNADEIEEIIFKEHTINNHRGIEEVYKELIPKYFYPKIRYEITKIINNCQTCQISKYDRNPIKEHFSRPFPDNSV